ncbi:TMF-regulated nuclear protein 1-like [Megalops cyprinoides]|uniref:TMF-regulated nuclear protein 1-like n=1 Tax=Megalops cyprinoides TaxID=118141 RepID=UPI0018655787|nr:TMF-regulated nuclear protein 1-like [Megalops cyprinoides]
MERLGGSRVLLSSLPERKRNNKESSLFCKRILQPDMKGRCHDTEDMDPEPEPETEPKPVPAASSSSSCAASASTRRSISMGDFRRVGPQARSDPPSAATTAPSSKLVTPSSSMEFEAARRRLLEVEERQRVIREMESRLEELRQVFVRSEQEVVEHGELVARIATAAQQGELYAAENGQRLKKGLRFKKHRPTIVFSSMLGLRTCLPWPMKLK